MTTSYTSIPALVALLRDPNRLTVSVSQAAALLGVAKSTAHAAYKATGYLSPGVPVMPVGRRYVVSTFHLRAALGMPDPTGDDE
jgi:hypothetical protein